MRKACRLIRSFRQAPQRKAFNKGAGLINVIDHPRIIASCSRKPYNMSACYGDTSGFLASRQSFLEGLNIVFEKLVCARQVHGDTVALVDAKDAGKGACSQDTALAGTDALVTNQPGLPLAIFTADCLPVFLFDPRTASIGLAHAGWKGTHKHIAAKTAEKMRGAFGADPADILAGFGPCIRQCCYEVSPEFKEFFGASVSREKDKAYFDMAQENKKQLLALGVKKEHVYDSNLCTCCRSDTYFSYRKEGSLAGRMMSVLMIKRVQGEK